MRARLLLLPISALAALALYVSAGTGAGPNPVTCEGYPEPRIYLENQSWWSPQPGPAEHPGTGNTGHIHVGMCFPLYQHVSGSTLHLDVTIKLHDLPAVPSKIRITAYNDFTWNTGIVVPPCSTSDCTHTYSLDFPLGQATRSGYREISTYLNVGNADGFVQRNWPRWGVFIDNPYPAGSGAGATLGDVGGDSWYSQSVIGGSTGAYAQSIIERASVPWNEVTGELTPVAGTWRPNVRFEARHNFAYIDPDLHAVPPSKGTVVYEADTLNTGYLYEQLAIDTTQLSNGLHKLVIGTSNVGTNGTNTGVLVVPFLVHNVVCT